MKPALETTAFKRDKSAYNQVEAEVHNVHNLKSCLAL